MGQRIVEEKKDADKSKDELINELDVLRDLNSRLKDVIWRYEKVADKNDVFRSLYDLEARKESSGSLSDQLQEKQKEVDLRGEELAVQNVELKAQLKEFIDHDDEVARMTAELLKVKEELEWRVVERTGELWAAHQSLVEKNRYLDAFFNHTITPLVLLDRDFNFIRVNEAYARACQRDMDEFPGHNHFEFYPSDARAIFEDVVRTRQPSQVTARPFVFPDHRDWGVTYWNWTLTPLLDDRGEVEALVFALEDVTEFKRAEIELEKHRDKLQELVQERTRDLEMANEHLRNEIIERKRAEETSRESEWQYRSLFEHMLNGFAYCKLLYDDSGNPEDFIYLAVNGAFGRLTGLENVVGKRATEVIPGIKESHPELFEIYGRVARTGKPEQFEIEFKPVAAWLSVSAYSIGPGYFTAIFNNITERKQAEEELRESKDQLSANLTALTLLHGVSMQYVQNGDIDTLLGDIVEAAMAIAGADMGNLQLVEPASGKLKIAAQRGFGQPFIEFFGSMAHDSQAACASAMHSGARVVVEDVTASPIFVGTPALEVLLRSGVRAVQSTPLLDRRGKVIGMLSTHWHNLHHPDDRVLSFIDMLARQAADIIERKWAEEAMKEAKQRSELYLDLMGHDINNMHQIALGYLEIAEGMMSRDDGRREFIEKPIEVLQRSAQLIKNVRKLQKLEEGMFQSQEVDVCRVLADVQRDFEAVPNKAITLNLNSCERCHVRANELLHDVFANLVGNAIKHTGNRANIGIGLNVVNGNGNQYCLVSVEDDGPGIPDDSKDIIFNRMSQVTIRAKGMGLGLYLVRSLVESYGGRVWVEDRVPGDHTKGARFVVMLPAAEK